MHAAQTERDCASWTVTTDSGATVRRLAASRNAICAVSIHSMLHGSRAMRQSCRVGGLGPRATSPARHSARRHAMPEEDGQLGQVRRTCSASRRGGRIRPESAPPHAQAPENRDDSDNGSRGSDRVHRQGTRRDGGCKGRPAPRAAQRKMCNTGAGGVDTAGDAGA